MLSKNKDIYSILSEKHGLHKSVVSIICNHPFVFAARRIPDLDDEKSLMFIYLFKIRLKNRFKTKKRITYEQRKEKRSINDESSESI